MSDPLIVKEYIVREFAPGVTPDRLADDYDLLANGVVDSLGLLRLVTWLGDHHGFDPDDVDLAEDDFRTVEAICRFVDRAVPAAGPDAAGDPARVAAEGAR
ncbi:phosphopantetheine-binding protein [Actinosynnema sp. NPDC050801]|jgi:acyl carrier protein|uniref:phosphopantetheine-binding protein n=1 Tax=unclassified Actinosynnema TaxID=2637065 RepID=UPI0033F3DDEB